MKKLYTFAMTIAAAAAALVSCSKYELASETEGSASASTVLHIVANAAQTKSVFSDKDGEVFHTLWTTNKEVCFSADGNALVAATPAFVGDGASAHFDVAFSDAGESGTVYAFSPKGNFVSEPKEGGFTSLYKSSETIYLIIPSEQKPLQNSVDEAAQTIVASADYSSSNPNVALNFRHIAAYGRMTISNFAGTIKSVELQFPESVAGTNCKYYYKTGTLDGLNVKSIILDPANVVDNTFWFAAAPIAGNAGEMRVKITDSKDDTYTKSITLTEQKPLPLVAGKMSSFTVNFSGVDKDGKTDACATFTMSKIASNCNWTNGEAYNIDADDTGNTDITVAYGGGGYNGRYYTSDSSWRLYTGGSMTVAAKPGITITKIELSKSGTLSGSGYDNTTGVWTGTASSVTLNVSANSRITKIQVWYTTSSGGQSVTVTTGSATVGQGEVTLKASYSGASSMPYTLGFQYGTSQDALDQTEYWNDAIPGLSGSYSVTVSGLSDGSIYYYRAVIQVGDKDYYGEVKSFTMTDKPQPVGQGWLELPAASAGSNYFSESLIVSGARNYSYLYDLSMYTALWVAYPLYNSICSGSCSSSWSFNPHIAEDLQINVKSSSYSGNYNANYSRGHQLPNADRDGNSAMKKQVYYLTNQTPQLQNGFNGSIWNTLENNLRGVATGNKTDTLYIVTGAAFRKVGGNEEIKYIHSTKVKPKDVPVPNYYWKVALRVKRNIAGDVTSACAIGAWFEHKNYASGTDWKNYAVSVDEIEQYTGFDFFVNLPDDIEAEAEKNTSWSSFSTFK